MFLFLLAVVCASQLSSTSRFAFVPRATPWENGPIERPSTVAANASAVSMAYVHAKSCFMTITGLSLTGQRCFLLFSLRNSS